MGDIITKFNGQEVKVFLDLVKLTKRAMAGEKVIIEIRRDGKTIRKEVTLGEWK